ncbi:MAG: imidazolonepropionase [Candidatus Rokubacteria bacterium]|nr:imidazolonepropionase [Candidatus Rokubacteria bacterium]MBI3824536.1 imidazolonepropionase [Candidatus Rokubacteria bacterium]
MSVPGDPAGVDLVVTGLRELVTCEPALGDGLLGVIPEAAMAAAAGRVVWVGPQSRLASAVGIPPAARQLDAHGRVGLPGFVDSHTHLVHAGSREHEYALRAPGASYQEIAAAGGGILSTVRATRAASVDELVELALPRLATLLRHGTTTVEIKSGYGLTTADELKMLEAIRRLGELQPVEVHATFCGAHEIPPEFKGRPDAYVDLVVDEMLPAVAERRLARYVDVFCEEGVFSVAQARRILEAGAQRGLRAKFHADEFVTLGGAELAAEIGALSADHLLRARPEGVARMKEAGVTAALLPGTAFFLGLPYAPARAFLETGARVALASDFNPGSSMGCNLQLVMTMAVSQMKMSPEEALLGVTLNAAHAMGLEGEVGSLRPGAWCDMLLADVPNWRHLSYVYGVNHVSRVLKRGWLVVSR